MSDKECVVCLLNFDKDDGPLPCGHWIHLSCVEKHFKPECPVCRTPLNIDVKGQLPDCDIAYDPSSIVDDRVYDYNEVLIPNMIIYTLMQQQIYLGDLIFNESDQEDEENPHGDNWNYEDV